MRYNYVAICICMYVAAYSKALMTKVIVCQCTWKHSFSNPVICVFAVPQTVHCTNLSALLLVIRTFVFMRFLSMLCQSWLLAECALQVLHSAARELRAAKVREASNCVF